MNAASDRPVPVPPPLELVLGFIRADAAAGRFDDWGSSTLIDEHTGVPSIDRELADELHLAAGLPRRFPFGNAGVLHVYGYWFSTVPTPFGYKRDRWADGGLARAFGLAADAFHVTSAGGVTPLARITSAALQVLQEPPAGAEVAEVRLGQRLSRVVFFHQAEGAAVSGGEADAPALVYGIADEPGGPLKLVTTFPFLGDPGPVMQAFVAEPGPRWNAAM